MFDFSILKFIRIGRTVSRVIDAIKSERKGQTNFGEMSTDIGEALIEYLVDGGVTVVDDKFGRTEGERADINMRLSQLLSEQASAPSIGKQTRIDVLRNENLES